MAFKNSKYKSPFYKVSWDVQRMLSIWADAMLSEWQGMEEMTGGERKWGESKEKNKMTNERREVGSATGMWGSEETPDFSRIQGLHRISQELWAALKVTGWEPSVCCPGLNVPLVFSASLWENLLHSSEIMITAMDPSSKQYRYTHVIFVFKDWVLPGSDGTHL